MFSKLAPSSIKVMF
ncbi:hypothetical protein K4B52_002043 [Shigella boydii]|nr:MULTISPECIES: hypothetical protein [Shigella]EJM2481615.1 hypothetical protein [Escherichia coli]HCS1528319.1 hypothetical protein [Shigella dysenteriae]HCS2350916.1 hypothetical protein [Shigella sonnei]EHW4873086.1 hypothetical protein [Shigella boydii]EHW5705279.1 hypothetical protein [Shigella boydii]